MPIPSFQEMFLPFLQCLVDGKDHHMQEVVTYIADHFKLTDEERAEMIPSGQTSKVANRVGWARTHLKFAGLIERTEWGVHRITPAGRSVFDKPPATFDLKFLDTIPQHYEWYHAEKKSRPVQPPVEEGVETPEERIGRAYTDFRATLAGEVIARVKSSDPIFFERLVIDLLLRMGYGGSRAEAAQATKASGDGGIDGVINEDRLGLDAVYVQAKRWENSVGEPQLRDFVGALHAHRASKGVFITTSEFTASAKAYVEKVQFKISLIDGRRLADLMIDFGVGVSLAHTYEIKKIDNDYFEEN